MISVKDNSEQDALDELRKRTQDVMVDDGTLYRFLFAREFNPSRAETMLRDMVEWRAENDMDNVLKWDVPSFLKEDLAFRMVGCDNFGVPILWAPAGKWKARKWVEAGNKLELMRYATYILETAFHNSTKLCHRKRITVIVDCEGLSFYEASYPESLRTLYNCCKLLEANYPEIIRKIYCVNAPWAFTIAYNFIKNILSKHTVSKIEVHGSRKNQWMSAVLQDTAQSSLPTEYFKDENGN